MSYAMSSTLYFSCPAFSPLLHAYFRLNLFNSQIDVSIHQLSLYLLTTHDIRGSIHYIDTDEQLEVLNVTTSRQLQFAFKDAGLALPDSNVLAFIEGCYQKYLQVGFINEIRLGYMFIILLGLVLSFIDISRDNADSIAMSFLTLPLPPLLCLGVSIFLPVLYAQTWEYLNIGVFFLLIAHTVHNYDALEFDDITSTAAADKTAGKIVAICTEMVLYVSFPSTLLKLNFVSSMAVNFAAFLWFVIYTTAAEMINTVIFRYLAETMLISFLVFGYVAYIQEHNRRRNFLEDFHRGIRQLQFSSKLAVLDSMRQHREGEGVVEDYHRRRTSVMHSFKKDPRYPHLDKQLDKQAKSLLRTGKISKLLSMIHSEDPIFQDEAAAELNAFIETIEENIESYSPAIQKAVAGLANIRQWISNLNVATSESQKLVKTSINVFLGGSCNPTTWRKDTAMPALDKGGVTYYNPQVDDWCEELVVIEAKAKEEANILLFVIDPLTRALASIVEATEYICSGREVILVINQVAPGTVIGGDTLTVREIKDLNRSRSYLKELAQRHGTQVFTTVNSAIKHIINLVKLDYWTAEERNEWFLQELNSHRNNTGDTKGIHFLHDKDAGVGGQMEARLNSLYTSTASALLSDKIGGGGSDSKTECNDNDHDKDNDKDNDNDTGSVHANIIITKEGEGDNNDDSDDPDNNEGTASLLCGDAQVNRALSSSNKANASLSAAPAVSTTAERGSSSSSLTTATTAPKAAAANSDSKTGEAAALADQRASPEKASDTVININRESETKTEHQRESAALHLGTTRRDARSVDNSPFVSPLLYSRSYRNVNKHNWNFPPKRIDTLTMSSSSTAAQARRLLLSGSVSAASAQQRLLTLQDSKTSMGTSKSKIAVSRTTTTPIESTTTSTDNNDSDKAVADMAPQKRKSIFRQGRRLSWQGSAHALVDDMKRAELTVRRESTIQAIEQESDSECKAKLMKELKGIRKAEKKRNEKRDQTRAKGKFEIDTVPVFSKIDVAKGARELLAIDTAENSADTDE